jgi:hypothetical protein
MSLIAGLFLIAAVGWLIWWSAVAGLVFLAAIVALMNLATAPDSKRPEELTSGMAVVPLVNFPAGLLVAPKSGLRASSSPGRASP